MGCVSSKILAKSGSYQEKVMNNSFQRSNLLEEIILSNSKSNGDQFLALLCTSNSVTRTIKDTDQSPAVAAAEPAKIETINVSELLAGLEEEQPADQEQHQEPEEGEKPSAQCCSDGAVGRAKSFRTVEEFDALVTQSNSSEQEQEQERPETPPSDHQVALAIQSNPSEQDEQPMTQEATGAKRRARARDLAELKVPAAFDFSKSGSLRDWLLRGGQIFSPGSYVTPKFGSLVVPSEQINGCQIVEQHAVFDPELVAQFEHAMKQLSMDEEHILKEIVEALEDGSEEKNTKLERSDEPVILQK